jgi:hypothetical protein
VVDCPNVDGLPTFAQIRRWLEAKERRQRYRLALVEETEYQERVNASGMMLVQDGRPSMVSRCAANV